MRSASPPPVFPLLLLAGLSSCCGQDSPQWSEIPPVQLAPDEVYTFDLAAFVADDRGDLTFAAAPEEGVLASVDGAELTLTAAYGFLGEAEVTLTATDACENAADTTFTVTVGDSDTGGGGGGDDCFTHLTYTQRGDAQQVYVAGSFNAWDPTATPLVNDGSGGWSVDLELAPGAYPYKFVEQNYDAGGSAAWACDPAAPYTQCDEGYTWDPSCPLNGASCNSLLIVPDCAAPVLDVTALRIDRIANTVTVTVSAAGDIATTTATLDGAPVEAWNGAGFQYTGSGLSDGRHTLRFTAVSSTGIAAEPVYVPFWLDDRRWESGLMYYVFVDRYANGDTGRDSSEGTTAWSTDYDGGDWQGVVDHLDDLDALGVTVLWLTAPQNNAEGAWDGLCNATYSGYHGYWPTSATGVEEHFGDEAKLHELIDAAHARGMRVMTDWVANHVHVDHPYYTDHPDWFNPQAMCGDANNWNDIPETCWFDDYLPDIRYYEDGPLVQMVDDAMDWVKEYDLDGFRVDAVKHMPHSVYYNFASRARHEIEHVDAGGDEDFYTVGETYTGDYGLIASYVGAQELDGQFDFPLYWSIVAAFARGEIGLSNGDGSLAAAYASSQAAFGPHLMGTFLGNHDVARFLAQATGEVSSLYGDSPCGGDGNLRGVDQPESDSTPYRELMLAWSFLLTTEGLPLVYYGDEIGLPGYNDPDNRQMMRFDGDLSGNEAMVLAHVQALGQARRAHPAFSSGTRSGWWEGEADFYAYARTTGDDQVLVLLNRGWGERTVSNGLAFAGLTAARWEDILTGEVFIASGDTLSVTVPALSSRVLVPG